MASKECASAGSKETKSRVISHTVAAQEFAHRYEVSSRQRSING